MSDQKKKPVLDEQTFEKLLEAAYVIQEHNRKRGELEQNLKAQAEQPREHQPFPGNVVQKTETVVGAASRSGADYAPTLAAIVEAQHQIQIRHLELDKAMCLVVEGVSRITNASGAAIVMLEGKNIRYRAGTGSSALPVGSEVPLESAICQATVLTGQVTLTEDVKAEKLFDSGPCLERGILSLIAVPIYQDGVVGALELYFDRASGFAEHDIHTCHLMAGLVTEALSRDAQSNLKKSVATERSTMIAAIERLKPDLAGMAKVRPAAGNSRDTPTSTPSGTFPCWKCGNGLLVEEQFCGKCGVARAEEDALSSMQSKFASAWHRQQMNSATTADVDEIASAEKPINRIAPETFEDDGHIEFPQVEDPVIPPVRFSFEERDEEISSSESFEAIQQGGKEEPSVSVEAVPNNSAQVSSTALVTQHPQEMIWTSAAKARAFLESVAVTHKASAVVRLWRAHRGYLYLAVALVLVIVVARGMWSDGSVTATGQGAAANSATNRRKRVSPDVDLSAFDKLLISLGLAEPPDAPEYKGNPDTQVWVDPHTALYYCPGSDLYGKTAKGRISTQRNAQLDQFEPADRKACD
ncbi:MAG TPA: GAF domain-containing protein [Candidatus Acidoferrum sp.]|nr:GAF domain-containing protein [Candidatus Acidoferrum sp.]